jgi:hypothetical protein
MLAVVHDTLDARDHMVAHETGRFSTFNQRVAGHDAGDVLESLPSVLPSVAASSGVMTVPQQPVLEAIGTASEVTGRGGADHQRMSVPAAPPGIAATASETASN